MFKQTNLTLSTCLLTLMEHIHFVGCLLLPCTNLKYPSTLWLMGINIYADPPVLRTFLLFFAAYEMQQKTLRRPFYQSPRYDINLIISINSLQTPLPPIPSPCCCASSRPLVRTIYLGMCVRNYNYAKPAQISAAAQRVPQCGIACKQCNYV